MNKIIKEDVNYVIDNCPFIKERLNKKSLLITGATGMLPSYMVYTLEELCCRGGFSCEIYLGVRNKDKAKMRFGDFLRQPFVHIFRADLTQPFEFKGRVDFIVHAASVASSDKYLTHPKEVILPNTVALVNLLEVARRQKCSGVLFFSSGAIYGHITGKDFITENDSGYLCPTEVRSCYAESKRLGEALCAAYSSEFGIKTCIARIAHTYGPTLDLNDSRVFAQFIKNVVEGHDIQMKSQGTSKRQFLYLADATDAFFRLLLLGSTGQAYNVCNCECFVSIKELAQTVCNIFPEKKLKVIYTPRKENDTYAEDKNANDIMLSDKKLRTLGWWPRTSIFAGFKRTALSFMQN